MIPVVGVSCGSYLGDRTTESVWDVNKHLHSFLNIYACSLFPYMVTDLVEVKFNVHGSFFARWVGCETCPWLLYFSFSSMHVEAGKAEQFLNCI
jgi:hypothetical protein